ncbi:MAG: ribosome silencing factor [Ruminococcus sp.]|jgi:ribosome-associated protein|nr:ribosome silencing factor [Ruminococcus sp.]
MPEIPENIKIALRALDSKKAQDIKLLHVTKQTIIADWFIIAGGSSVTQTRALADEVEFKLKEAGITPKNIEQDKGHLWIILDYYDFLIHVFHKDTREFYDLERLWRDAEDVDLSGVLG